MMKKFNYRLSCFCFSVILFHVSDIVAEGGTTSLGSRQAAMGRSSVALTDIWSVHNNQAGIARLEKYGIGLYYENRFYIQQLSFKALAIVAPAKVGTFGLSFTHFGYELYADMKLGLAYARAFGPHFAVGIQLDYLLTQFGDNYGSKNSISCEIGIQSKVTKTLTIGAWIYNPVNISLSETSAHDIPIIFKLGTAWQISEQFLCSVEVEKNSQLTPLLLRIGLEYCIKQKFFLRAGVTSHREIFSMGFGMRLKIVHFDISCVMHQSLGFSPQSSLIVEF